MSNVQKQGSTQHRFLPSLSDRTLRVVFSLMALLVFIRIITLAIGTIPGSVIHTDDCLWQMRQRASGDSVLVVVTVSPGGAADRAGVRVGDTVVSIGGVDMLPRPMKSGNALMYHAQDVLNWQPVGVPLDYTVARNGRILPLTIVLAEQFMFFPLLMPVMALLWLIIGLVVVFPRPRGKVQQTFFAQSLLVIFAFTYPQEGGVGIGVIASHLWFAAGNLFFLLWLYFCTIFPVNQKVLGTRTGNAILGTFIAVVAISIGASAAYVAFDVEIPTWMRASIGYVVTALRALAFVGGVLYLYRGYTRLPASADRRPIAVILIGSILAGMALMYATIIQTTIPGVAILYPQYLLPVMFMLALPVSFGYAVFRYQVMDLGRVVRTTMVYTITMALIAGLYLAAGYGFGQILGSLILDQFRETAKVLSFVLFVMLFDPLKRRLQTSIENRFFPQRRDYSGRLATYAAEITETVGAKAVAERTAITLQHALDLRGVCVAIEDPRTGDITPVARASEFAPVPVDSDGIDALRHLLRQSHNLILLETTADPALENLQMYFPYVIGLYAQGRVTGAILMSRPHDDENLSGSQISFIAGVAAQAAAALEVARLYEEELEQQRYREELATARRIQESLLPAEMPLIPGISISASSRPAQTVGGDYYDVIPLGNDRFLVTIADVSGKGLPASLYMAEFHGMVHVACGINSSPRAILSTLNQHLFEVITRGSFITATMLVFDTARRSVSYARAGHTPIIRRNGSEVDTLVPTGVALGLCARGLFEELLTEYTVEYEEGETFILYSDGVSEAMNAERAEFGEGRLHDIISGTADTSAEMLRNRILTQVDAFRDKAEQNDDITIVVIRVDKSNAPTPLLLAPASHRPSEG